MLSAKRPRWFWPVTVGIAAVMLAWIAQKISHLFAMDAPVARVASQEDVKDAVNRAALHMPDVSVKQYTAPIIRRSPGEEAITFLVESRMEKEYKFDSTEFRLLRYQGDLTKIDLNQMATEIDQIYLAKDDTSFSKLTATGTLSGGYPPYFSGSVSVSGPLRALLETLGLIRSISKLDVDHIDVAIKGYADGELGTEWQKGTPPLDPKYRNFSVLKPEDEIFSFYTKQEEKHQFKHPEVHYANEDLPDLRAQFVRVAFVQPFIQGCIRRDLCHAYVLHDEPLPKRKGQPDMNPEMRKVQVYLMVYVKKPKQ